MTKCEMTFSKVLRMKPVLRVLSLGIVMGMFCVSDAMASTDVAPINRKPVDIQGRDVCAETYNELGRYISAANAYLFDQEKSIGGVLEWSEAEAIRNKIDIELYWYSEYLAYHVADADVALCQKVKNDGIEKVNDIVRKGMGWHPEK